MANQYPVDIQQIIDQKMATGDYSSPEQLILFALHSLDDYEQSVSDIQEGIEDEAAGRLHSLADADAKIRQELGFSK